MAEIGQRCELFCYSKCGSCKSLKDLLQVRNEGNFKMKMIKNENGSYKKCTQSYSNWICSGIAENTLTHL